MFLTPTVFGLGTTTVLQVRLESVTESFFIPYVIGTKTDSGVVKNWHLPAAVFPLVAWFFNTTVQAKALTHAS